MRVAVATIAQESNTFSPVLDGWAAFETFGYHVGEQIPLNNDGTGALGGFARRAWTRDGIELVPLVRAQAGAGGRVEGPVFDAILTEFITRLRSAGPVDAVYLDLHGAMASTDEDDPEGHVLLAAREVVGPEVPIVASLDHHANVTARMVSTADALVGHRTQPHDPPHTGEEAAKVLFQLVEQGLCPTMALRKAPMVTHQEQYLTRQPPMKTWFDLAREMESRPGVITVSTFPMQPWLDVDEGGWASVVVTDDDPGLAGELAEELTRCVWGLRDDLMVQQSIPVEEAVARIIEAPSSGVVVLSDTGDSILGGATGDSNELLAELLRQRIPGTALVPLVDPSAARAAADAGVGARLELPLGRALDPTWGEPLVTEVEVLAVTDGVVTAPGGFADELRQGTSALLRNGDVLITVSERRGIGGVAPGHWTHFGVDPADARCVVVKTASNFQFLASFTSEVIRVDTAGQTQSRVADFDWTRLPRPAFPLDADARLPF